jgi:hypothetical protein
VFENNIILFSDKQCGFPDSGNLDLDWARWYRRAVEKSAHQLWGAERWIKAHPDRVFLDAQCTKAFPLSLQANPATVFHRVLIAHGASTRCKRELGGSGSLMVSSGVVGNAHTLPREDGGTPFMVGQVDASKGYIHILDDTTCDILLSTLDTIADLTAYFAKKQRFIESGVILSAAGEEELLAYYLTHINADKEYDFVFERGDFGGVSLDSGFWADFVKSPQRKSQLEANKISYIWDDIIERFAHHFLKGTSHFLSDTSLSSHETILRFFAREMRVRRRMLASALIEMLKTTPPHIRRLRVLRPSRPGDPYFVLLLLPMLPNHSYEENRDVRRAFLNACCAVVKLEFTDALDIVGFATETSTSSEGRSEDAAYFDTRQWSEEMAAAATRDKDALKILTSATIIEGTEYDYPLES